MKLLTLLFSYIFITQCIHSELTDKQEKRINNMAWLFAQFSMTFDPNEISKSLKNEINKLTINTNSEFDGDEAMLTLNSYFRNNEKEFDNYKDVLDYFDNDSLKSLFPSIDLNELIKIFEDRIKIHQNDIVTKDQTPLTFKQFYSIFQMLRDFIENGESKFEALGDIPVNHPLMQTFCNQFNLKNDQDVINSLQNFKIGEYTQNDKELTKSLALFHPFMNSLANNENVRDPIPTRWQTHHMIPADRLVTFYKYYFKLLIAKSSKMQTKFDWIKIIQYNTQKTFLVEGTKLWRRFPKIIRKTKLTEPPPVYNFDKNPNSAQENFVKYWYKWPIGLLFYGPRSLDRSDDPTNEFEISAANIVGQKYFDKVEELNSNILAFIAAYELNNENDDLNDMAMKIYNRIVTIHREASWDNKIIAPFNSNQWELNLGKWNINLNWSIKSLAQQQDLEEQQNNLVQFVSNLERVQLMDPILLGAYYSYRVHQAGHSHDELKRRKRHHLYDHLFYIQQLETKCLAPATIIQKKDDWELRSLSISDRCDYYLNNGSPSILAVPVYGWCKLFG
ncbi:MAG: hypothetical protein ACRCZ0_07245 [Cetobacterium sp.]